MRRRRVVLALLGLALVQVHVDGAERESSARPVLKLRSSRNTVMSPARVLLTAELVGGAEREEFYCPEVEWDFADGSRSVRQEDCEPYGATTMLERRFTSPHAFVIPGQYVVTVTLRHADNVVARAEALVVVHGMEGGAEPSAEIR
jgi:hypothetical protein